MEKKLLKLNEQELNVILFALQKQPFEMVNELMHNIVNQIKLQQVVVDSKKEDIKIE